MHKKILSRATRNAVEEAEHLAELLNGELRGVLLRWFVEHPDDKALLSEALGISEGGLCRQSRGDIPVQARIEAAAAVLAPALRTELALARDHVLRPAARTTGRVMPAIWGLIGQAGEAQATPARAAADGVIDAAERIEARAALARLLTDVQGLDAELAAADVAPPRAVRAVAR